MNNLLIYKEGQSLKEYFVHNSLSITSPYKLYFCTKEDQIFKLISEGKAQMLYYFCDNLTIEDKVLIRKIHKFDPRLKIILYSHESHALEAWNMDIFHFENHPVTFEQVKRGYQKYLANQNPKVALKMTIKLPEGTYQIPLRDIKYLHANGNYTFIHYGADQSKLITKKLGQFEHLAEKDSNFERVHRSLMINLNAISKVKGQEIHFNQGGKSLSISISLSNKIKKRLVG